MNTLFDAVEILRGGGVVAVPTETVYGLAADATNDAAVARIFALKNRPRFNPLIIHVPSVDAAKNEVVWCDTAEKLARTFWPGALTLVLPKSPRSRVSLLASAGLETLAIRVPQHPLIKKILEEVATPLAAPSANRSGRLSPTCAAHVEEEFLGTALTVVDGGACGVGLESTVVDVTAVPTILRHGAVTKSMLENILGVSVAVVGNGDSVRSPGQLLRHYAPRIPLKINAQQVLPTEALPAFGAPFSGAKTMLNLSEEGNLEHAAARLFRYLRALDTPEHSAICVMPIPQEGIGMAINDRLQRGCVGAD